MSAISFGLDVGGEYGTILSVLKIVNGQVILVEAIKIRTVTSLKPILIKYKAKKKTLVIDAPLSYDKNSTAGFRDIDRAYSEVINDEEIARNRVKSVHSLMAVPIKGIAFQKVAGELKVGALETHPYIFLARMYQERKLNLSNLPRYKNNSWQGGKPSKKQLQDTRKFLWEMLLDSGGVQVLDEESLPKLDDDLIDSLVCALVGISKIADPKTIKNRSARAFFKKIKKVGSWTKKDSLVDLAGEAWTYDP